MEKKMLGLVVGLVACVFNFFLTAASMMRLFEEYNAETVAKRRFKTFLPDVVIVTGGVCGFLSGFFVLLEALLRLSL
jgi:hypothetical protein